LKPTKHTFQTLQDGGATAHHSDRRGDPCEVTKQRTLHRCGVDHYWMVDPERRLLVVQRWQPDGYLVVLTADRSETVRAEPFDAIELRVGLLFGEDPDES
jgi:hypothetical protein